MDLAKEPSKAIDGNDATWYEIGGENRTIDNRWNVESYLKESEDYNPAVGLFEGIEYKLWWEVHLEKEYLIQELIIDCDNMNSIYQILIFNEMGETVFAANKLTEARIKVPYVRGERVRILFHRDSVLGIETAPLITDYSVPSSVSLYQVMVIEAKFGPTVKVDIPLDRLILEDTTDPNEDDDANENASENGHDYNDDDTEPKYGSFDHFALVQSTPHASTTSRISDIKFLYVAAEELNWLV